MKTAKSRTGDRRSEVGFSLLELIIVLVILGLLASVVGPRIVGEGWKAKVKVAKIQIEELGEALEAFRLEIGRYPTTNEGLRPLAENTGIEGWDGPYLRKPFVPKDPWKREYQYLSPGQHGDYDIWSFGADGVPGGEKEDVDVTSWSE